MPAGRLAVRALGVLTLVASAALAGCSRSNNVLLGRVETRLGSHVVVVTDCYRLRAQEAQRLPDTAAGEPVYRYAPCKDTDILVSGRRLIVNGTSYGDIPSNASITVDHGRVLVNDMGAVPAAVRPQPEVSHPAGATAKPGGGR